MKVKAGDVRGQLAEAALGQRFISDAPVIIVLAADPDPTAERYGDRAKRYVLMEAGHVSQNIYLQVTAMNLGTVSVGAFNGNEVRNACGLSREVEPLYVMPVGHPVEE